MDASSSALSGYKRASMACARHSAARGALVWLCFLLLSHVHLGAPRGRGEASGDSSRDADLIRSSSRGSRVRGICRGRDGGCDVRLATYNYRTNQACNLQPRTLEPAATCNQQNPRTRNVLVCRYARSLRLAARQNTPAFDGAFYRPNGTSYQLQPSFHTYSTEPEPTARARRAGKELY